MELSYVSFSIYPDAEHRAKGDVRYQDSGIRAFASNVLQVFDRNPIGKLVTRTVNDVEVLNEMLTSGLILVFSDLFTLAGIFIMLAWLDWRLMLVVCAVFPFLAWATHAYRVRARDALRKTGRTRQRSIHILKKPFRVCRPSRCLIRK